MHSGSACSSLMASPRAISCPCSCTSAAHRRARGRVLSAPGIRSGLSRGRDRCAHSRPSPSALEGRGATQSVAWPWVLLCELALASFLTPNARFQPLASFSVYSLTWSFFLHPGSCHTSNLLRLYHNVLHGLEEKANAHRAAERQRLAANALPNPAAQRVLKEQKKKLITAHNVSPRHRLLGGHRAAHRVLSWLDSGRRIHGRRHSSSSGFRPSSE